MFPILVFKEGTMLPVIASIARHSTTEACKKNNLRIATTLPAVSRDGAGITNSEIFRKMLIKWAGR